MADNDSKPNHMTYSGKPLKSIAGTVEDGMETGASRFAEPEKRAKHLARVQARRKGHGQAEIS